MSSRFTSRQIASSLRRTKAPGEGEFSALFQLFPGPALLLDTTREQIVIANSAFLQLTTFALTDIQGKAPVSLIGGLPSHPLASDEILSVMLDRRNRSPLACNLQVRVLDALGQWLVLCFEPQEERKKNLAARLENIVQTLAELGSIREGATTRQTVEGALVLIQRLLDSSAVSLYSLENEKNRYSMIGAAGESGLLPDSIPVSDLPRLSQTVIWRPGRRVQTELHRGARVNSLTYVASAPTSQDSLLVVADRFQEPAEHLEMVLEALRTQVSGLLDRMKMMNELRRQALENRRELSVWRMVGENAQEGILLLTPDLKVTAMNTAAEWMLGYADREVQNQPAENILIGPDRLLPALENALQGIPTHNMGSVSLHRRNGQLFPAHMQIVPVQREGEPLAVVVFFSDVSEHEEIRNRTQQLEQRAVLGEVTAVFAHEVRNPINNISTGLQLLTVKLPENDPNQENISRLINDCLRLNHLMESVLNFSRQSEHRFEEVDLDAMLRRMLDRWRPRFAKVNVSPYINIEDKTPHVLADPRSLDQVFTNLIGNAVEAMSSSGGTLSVRVAPLHGLPGRPQVEIQISDSGPGIPDEIRDRIFEPFVSTKSGGTGLGLAITKRIITAHHGSISVNSFPGGTVFHVLLSVYEGENP
jgi:PAS domain S-box-containing protein